MLNAERKSSRAGLLRGHARWLAHALDPRPNPLRRGVDRVTAVVTLVLILGVLLAVPVSALVGNAVLEQQKALGAAEAAQRHQVAAVVDSPPEAVVVGDATSPQATKVQAPVRWTAPDGSAHVARSEVRPGSEAGDVVPMWVSADGNIAAPPRTEQQAAGAAVVIGLAVMVSVQLLCALAIMGVWRVADLRASRAWQREWEITQPQWTRRDRR